MNTQMIYETLKKELKDVILSPPNKNEDVNLYLKRILTETALKPYFITKDELDGLIPSTNTSENWQKCEKGLRAIAEKIKDPKVLFIQGINGKIHPKIELSNISKQIYDQTLDYSLGQSLGAIVDEELLKYPAHKMTHEEKTRFINILLMQIPLLNSEGSLFQEGLKVALFGESFQEINESELENIITNIINKFVKTGVEEIIRIDHEILGERNEINGLPGVEFFESKKPPAKKGVLIMTSSGGGCHKTIANNTIANLNEQGIDCALINESELTQDDPLKHFIGIAHSSLYPVVFQQCGNLDCKNLLSEIDMNLNQKFCPPIKFAQLREAVKLCEEKRPISLMYSTQHYAHDFRIMPKECKALFQVCDYSVTTKLRTLQDLSGQIPYNDTLQFLIPSKSCIPSTTLPENYDSGLFTEVIYPTIILSNEESAAEFNNFITANHLYSKDEKDVIRCSIVMGGQGCGELIDSYIKKILLESKNSKKKMEFVVACGTNDNLKKDLMRKFDRIDDNIKLRICGKIPNKELIAYNKNAVLISKPGGGTISECMQNDIQILVHYDEKHFWEAGNVKEICESQKGNKIDLNKPLLFQIEENTYIRKERDVKKEEKENEFHKDVIDLQKELTSIIQNQNKRRLVDYNFVAALAELKESLGKLQKASLTEQSTIIQLNSIKNAVHKIYGEHQNVPGFNMAKMFVENYVGKTSVHHVLTSHLKLG